MSQPLRIFLVDDHKLVHDGIRAMLLGNISFGSTDMHALRSVTGRELDRVAMADTNMSANTEYAINKAPSKLRDELRRQSQLSAIRRRSPYNGGGRTRGRP